MGWNGPKRVQGTRSDFRRLSLAEQKKSWFCVDTALIILRKTTSTTTTTGNNNNNMKLRRKQRKNLVNNTTQYYISSITEMNNDDDDYKMVFCVNQELGMGKGKIAVQCCHAALGCYKRATQQSPNAVRAWETTSGCAKIVLKCPTLDEMESIAMKALERDLPVYLVTDAGQTQIEAGSRTVLGIGPAPTSAFEGVSSHLQLM